MPYLVPPTADGAGITIAQAASAPESQRFLLVGTVFLLPVILGYTVFVYWVFRGKVGEGYH
jgi:cytochrome d ubiquinol oxidase subunit II